MLIKYTLNNYQVGAKLKSAPLNNLISQERVDESSTEVIFDVNERQAQFLDKLFAKKGVRL